MKKYVFYVGLGLLSIFVLSSCLDLDDKGYISYGVIRNVNSASDYEILTDKGNTLKVLKSYTTQTIENDKRVLVNYELLSEKEKSKKVYDVSVKGFYNLLTKPVIYESFIRESEEIRRDSIGNDPFGHIHAAFGGNYINIDFQVWHSTYSNQKHLINLVYDDTRGSSDTIYLRLYHNAYGEVLNSHSNLTKGTGRSSFKISDLLPQGVTSKPVTITWTEYSNYSDSRERSSTGVFKLGDTSDKRFELHIGFDSSIEVK